MPCRYMYLILISFALVVKVAASSCSPVVLDTPVLISPSSDTENEHLAVVSSGKGYSAMRLVGDEGESAECEWVLENEMDSKSEGCSDNFEIKLFKQGSRGYPLLAKSNGDLTINLGNSGARGPKSTPLWNIQCTVCPWDNSTNLVGSNCIISSQNKGTNLCITKDDKRGTIGLQPCSKAQNSYQEFTIYTSPYRFELSGSQKSFTSVTDLTDNANENASISPETANMILKNETILIGLIAATLVVLLVILSVILIKPYLKPKAASRKFDRRESSIHFVRGGGGSAGMGKAPPGYNYEGLALTEGAARDVHDHDG